MKVANNPQQRAIIEICRDLLLKLGVSVQLSHHSDGCEGSSGTRRHFCSSTTLTRADPQVCDPTSASSLCFVSSDSSRTPDAFPALTSHRKQFILVVPTSTNQFWELHYNPWFSQSQPGRLESSWTWNTPKLTQSPWQRARNSGLTPFCCRAVRKALWRPYISFKNKKSSFSTDLSVIVDCVPLIGAFGEKSYYPMYILLFLRGCYRGFAPHKRWGSGSSLAPGGTCTENKLSTKNKPIRKFSRRISSPRKWGVEDVRQNKQKRNNKNK